MLNTSEYIDVTLNMIVFMEEFWVPRPFIFPPQGVVRLATLQKNDQVHKVNDSGNE